MDLKNKIVVITGSSSGIGKTTAIRFAKEGAKIVVNYRINKAGGEETLKKVNRYSEGILVQADISSPDDIDKLFQQVVSKYKTIDILINNAAVPNEKVPFLKASPYDLSQLLTTNIVGTMLCSKKAIEIMTGNSLGKIINTSSIKGWEHGGGGVTYAVSKAAINSLTRTLAKLVAPNILVNAVAPGYVKTRSYDNMTQDKLDSFIAQTYLKRWVTEDEIADAFIFLAKNDAMTGQVIYVDAGFTLK